VELEDQMKTNETMKDKILIFNFIKVCISFVLIIKVFIREMGATLFKSKPIRVGTHVLLCQCLDLNEFNSN
jgi:hypothetical protein